MQGSANPGNDNGGLVSLMIECKSKLSLSITLTSGWIGSIPSGPGIFIQEFNYHSLANDQFLCGFSAAEGINNLINN
jgi:hypothetical protein